MQKLVTLFILSFFFFIDYRSLRAEDGIDLDTCIHCCPLKYQNGIDFEDFIQDFVLETKKIEVPESPNAFNPSIIRWQGRLLMAFRQISKFPQMIKLPSSSASSIGLVWLDENFNPVGAPRILRQTERNQPSDPMYFEDGRLIVINDRLYVIYTGNSEQILEDKGFKMFVSELDFDGREFRVISTECLSSFKGSRKNLRERNWVPFEYAGKLLLAYSLRPHKILMPLLNNTGKCESYASSHPSAVWDWGQLRGGTPALPIDDKLNLAFFHSSIYISTAHSHNQLTRHYFMGAYTFSREPPFEIKQISPEPIVGKNFYRGPLYKPYWNPVNVIFPCGFFVDENYIWVTYGRQDHEMWVVKLDKRGLLDGLIRVSTLPE
jgi:predicted GH43/DUF377 family glycosyl hydrolase